MRFEAESGPLRAEFPERQEKKLSSGKFPKEKYGQFQTPISHALDRGLRRHKGDKSRQGVDAKLESPAEQATFPETANALRVANDREL